jgi:hypothetical protein
MTVLAVKVVNFNAAAALRKNTEQKHNQSKKNRGTDPQREVPFKIRIVALRFQHEALSVRNFKQSDGQLCSKKST